jgi:hypothetical protein
MRDLGVLLRWLALSPLPLATATSGAQGPDVSRDTQRVIAVDGDRRFQRPKCEVSTGCPFDLNARSWL